MALRDVLYVGEMAAQHTRGLKSSKPFLRCQPRIHLLLPMCIYRLRRTFRESSELLNTIDHLDVIWMLEEDQDDANNLLEDLLEQLGHSQSLKYLHLNLGEISFELTTMPFALRPPTEHNRTFLAFQELEITTSRYDDLMPADHVFRLAALPFLHTLRIDCPIYQFNDCQVPDSPLDTRLQKAPAMIERRFNLETLEFEVALRVPNT